MQAHTSVSRFAGAVCLQTEVKTLHQQKGHSGLALVARSPAACAEDTAAVRGADQGVAHHQASAGVESTTEGHDGTKATDWKSVI